MAVTSNEPAPYAPGSTILRIIDRYRHHGMQSPFTAEVLERAGVSDSLIPRTIRALQSLELIDESGEPTETLNRLAKAPESDYQDLLGEWVRRVYSDVFSFADPATDNRDTIRDAFRSYEPRAQQLRMVALFMRLCRVRGLLGEEQEQPPRTIPQPISGKPRQRARARTSKQKSDLGIPSPLAGLLHSLPDEGQAWTQTDRKKFMTTFGAVLDFCFPIQQKPSDSEDEDG